jgi:hypothetical protein
LPASASTNMRTAVNEIIGMNTLDNLKKILFYPIIFELTLTFVTYIGNYASLKTSELLDWSLTILTVLITYGWIGWHTWSSVRGGIKLAFTAAVLYLFFWILVQTAVVYFTGSHDLVTKSQVMLGMFISSMFVLFPASLFITLVFWYASKKSSLYKM